MPYSTNTKHGEFGHAQLIRDIEYLYLYLRGDTTTTVKQDVTDDGFTGETVDNRIQRIAQQFAGAAGVSVSITPILVTTTNNKLLGYASLRGAKYSATPFGPANKLTTAYDPAAQVAITDDGICYGTNLFLGSPCLLTNRNLLGADGTTFLSVNNLTFDLPQDCLFLAYRQIDIPVTAANDISVWEGHWA